LGLWPEGPKSRPGRQRARFFNYWINIIHIFYLLDFFAIQKQSIHLKEKKSAILLMSIIYKSVEYREPNLIGLRPHPRATSSYSWSNYDIMKITIDGSCAREASYWSI